MKIYIEDNLLDIRLLKELKSKFQLVKNNTDVDISLKGNIVSYNDENIDLNDLLKKNETKEKCLNSINILDRNIETLKQALKVRNELTIRNFIKQLEVAKGIYYLLLIKKY